MPTNAEVGSLEALCVDELDQHMSPIGTKGIGEIGITGSAAAMASAVYHATGKRVRDLPITLDKFYEFTRSQTSARLINIENGPLHSQ